MTAERTTSAITVGRRGFVGALAGGLSAAAGAASWPAAASLADRLAGEVARIASRTTAGTAFDAVTVDVPHAAGLRIRVLLPRAAGTDGEVVWLHGAAFPGADGASGGALDAGAAVVEMPPGATEPQHLAAFHWAADQLRRSRSVVVGVVAGAPSAAAVVADRVLPRVLGLLLISPDDLDLGRPLFWTGRRVRVAGTPAPALASSLLAIGRRAAEASVTPASDVAGDVSATLARWRAAVR